MDNFRQKFSVTAFRRTMHDRDNALLISLRIFDFKVADTRCKGVRTDDENEGIGRVNPGLDFAPPIGGIGNTFPIDP